MKITIINTGGTFNKKYNMLNGELEVLKDSSSLKDIIKWSNNIEFEIIETISKDSLDITNEDREKLVKKINSCKNEKIIIVHGTDTMNETASFIENRVKNKKIVLTGAMIPMSIDKLEATMNLSMAIGFLNAKIENAVYISLHGAVVSHKSISKNKNLGRFNKI